MDPVTIMAAATAALKLVDTVILDLQARREAGGKEWTAEAEAAYDKLVAERMQMAHWKPSGRTE